MKKIEIQHLLYSTILNYNDPTNQHLPTESDMICLISAASEISEKENFAIILDGEWTIVGDIHGDAFSLIRIFTANGYPPDKKYLFLGDYVDRGQNSIEVMIILMCLKILYRNSIFFLRVNHEFQNMTMIYGFYKECLMKMNIKVYQAFMSYFDQLPIVALINGRIFCTHGGISKRAKDFVDIFDLTKPKKTDDLKKLKIINDLLWSDPSSTTDFFERSDRYKKTYVFGEKAVDAFLDENEFYCIVRGHQVCINGYNKPFGNDKCWTVFSSADYCQMYNQAAVLIVKEGLVNNVIVFEPVTKNEKKKERVILPKWIIENDDQI